MFSLMNLTRPSPNRKWPPPYVIAAEAIRTALGAGIDRIVERHGDSSKQVIRAMRAATPGIPVADPTSRAAASLAFADHEGVRGAVGHVAEF